jgi:DNA-binding MarR family transcriptional regulator
MHDDDAAIPPDLAFLLTRACSRFSRMAIRRADVDVSSVAWRITSMLDELGPMRLSEIALRENVARPTSTATIQRLEEAGIVSRTPDPTDARSRLVSLTEVGREHLTVWRSRLSEGASDLLGDLPAEDVATLERTVGILRTILETQEGTPPPS